MDRLARHQEYSENFAALTRGVTEWSAASPVRGWTARDVVRHLVTWPREFLVAWADLPLDDVTSIDDDPIAAWDEHWRQLHDALTRWPDRPVSNPHLGVTTLLPCLDMIYTSDVFLHSWDLAEASRQRAPMDAATCEAMLAGMRPMEAALRASGQYGPAVSVADDAPPEVRLMAFLGRDPAWRD